MAKLIAGVYSEALFEVGIEENNLDLYQQELGLVIDLLHQDEAFDEFFKTPRIGKDEKRVFIDEVFAGKFSPIIVNLMKVLVDKKRSGYIEEIKADFDDKLRVHRNQVKAVAETAVPLTESEMQALGQKLSVLTGKQIELVNALSPEVIGGIRLKVGDRVIDGSLKRRLEDMEDGLAQLIV